MIVTIFTPTYNRAHSIEKVYNSLCCQTNKNFEWLLINDGSTDSTDAVINHFISTHDKSFPIRYIKKINEGLMRTINQAIDLAEGEFFCRLDSDDYALPTLVQLIIENAHFIRGKEDLCSIAFLSQKMDGIINGYHPFSKPTRSNFTEYRDKYNAIGDRSEVMKTDVLRKYKFPEFINEKFCPEGLVWNRIAQKYDAIYIPMPIYVKGENEDSITSQIYFHLKKNCKGTTLYYYEIIINKKLSFRYRFINTIKYYRYAFFAKASIIIGIPKHLCILGLPCGLLVMLYDKIKYK